MGFERYVNQEIVRIAREIIAQRESICDHCLGRQFAQIGHGFTNAKRGKAIRKIIGLKKKPGPCPVCRDFFKNLEKISERIVEALKDFEFKTFVVGTKLDGDLIKREESLWEDVGIKYCESIKSEINRELGKLIERKTGKKADRENPEITIILNTEDMDFEIEPSPLYIYGRYKKLVRGIPQTKWDKYPETVEDIIAEPFMNLTGGETHSFHGMGREDIDARCLDWRPFVLEIKKPKRRNIDLKKAEREVNKSEKVRVSGLRFSNKEEVVRVKDARPDKTYRVIVEFEKPLNKEDLEKIKSLVGEIHQRTPARVLHRRADALRKRKVKEIGIRMINNKKLELEIKGEAGLYIKELVTGDNGRTKPSLAEIIGKTPRVVELDVIKIHWKEGERKNGKDE